MTKIPLEASLCYLSIDATRLDGGRAFFLSFFSFLSLKLQFDPFFCWFFNFNPYYFNF